MNELISKESKSIQQERKTSTWEKTAKVSLTVLYFALVVIALIKFDPSKVHVLIDQHQNLAFLIGLVVIFFAFLAMIPTIPLTALFTAIIGPLPATIITALGTTLAAGVHYHIGKQIGDVLNFEKKRTRLPFRLGKLPVNSPLFLLVGRALPGCPTGLNFVCGAYTVPIFIFFWTTFTMNLLGAAFIAFGGDQLFGR
jgi:uncharacterized membrane protein YdjX (TVP38/TMEM64 family)